MPLSCNPTILDFVASLGFNVLSLPHILSLPEAGRTQACVGAWQIITESKWIHRVIESGVTWSWKVGPPDESFRAPGGRIGDMDVLRNEFQELWRKGALVTREGLPPPLNGKI